jgi:hypothetical protein
MIPHLFAGITLYNGVPDEAVYAIGLFMKEFQQRHDKISSKL